MPVPTPDEFWKILVRSRLLEPGAAAALRAEHAGLPAAETGDGSAKSIAAWLYGRGVLTRWQAKRVAVGDLGPFFLGDYRLLERHDRDGGGLLFTARHDPSGRIVDLMLLNAKQCRELDVWTEIVKRTTAANRATDPMLTRTWSLEQHGGTRFIVCEHVEGDNLADELERLGPLPHQPAGVLVWQVARAVAELHGLGTVHGALSLDVLRREPPPPGAAERAGRVRLLQFPLACDPHRVPMRPLVADDAEVARLARRAAFVAPELLVPGSTCDTRSDVYAIGAILYALLAGRAPCWDGDPKATLTKASFAGATPLPPTVPEEITTLVGYLMARDPDGRYPTAGDAADAIAACLGLSVPAAPKAAAPSGGADDIGEMPDFSGAAAASIGSTAPASGAGQPAASAGPPVSAAVLAANKRAARMRMIGGITAAAILAAAAGLVVSRLDFGKPVVLPPRDVAERPAPMPVDRPPPAEERRPSGGGEQPRSETRPTDRPDPGMEVATQPAEARPDRRPRAPTSGTTAAPAQVVVDDPTLPWASPTTGRPPTLAYLPPGSQLILLARLRDIARDDEGSLFLKSLGPTADAAVAELVKLAGGDIESIELVQAGWQAGGPDEVVGAYAVRFAEGRSAPADDDSRKEAWGQTSEAEIGGETVHQTATLSLWTPAAEKGRVLVIAPKIAVPKDVTLGPAGVAESGKEPLIARIIRESLAAIAAAKENGTALAAALPRDLEVLVGMLDADRHVTLLGSPHYLMNTGRPVLAGPLAKLAEPMDALFGESLQAAALSLHFGTNFYVEMDAIATLDIAASQLATDIASRVDELPTQVETYCTALNPDPYGRLLVLRLPSMIRAVAAQMRSGAEDKGVVLNAYLPRHAAHNLALAAELALAQTPGAAVATAGPSQPAAATPKGALGKLQKKMTLTFAKDNLERSIQMVSDEAGVPMEILGGDLQLEGITKNQSFGLEERDKTADEVLRVILAKSNPDGKLVYIVKEKDGEEWVYITTRASVEKRGDKLPPAFADQPKPKKP
jgi:eukaryotic-like serine/threonine-protein kinase